MKSVSGKHVCTVLETNGWVLKRIRSSHHIYSKPGARNIVTVPVHGNKDLKIGTLKKILKDAELTENDL
ncbi:MAG: type II toxin-antitoxin system HicA family toxin [Planctomycetes bacterium]|nr:type II toxin-antitoxin system HicA family toxin [Planctomycetota bacterium]